MPIAVGLYWLMNHSVSMSCCVLKFHQRLWVPLAAYRHIYGCIQQGRVAYQFVPEDDITIWCVLQVLFFLKWYFNLSMNFNITNHPKCPPKCSPKLPSKVSPKMSSPNTLWPSKMSPQMSWKYPKNKSSEMSSFGVWEQQVLKNVPPEQPPN